MGWLKDVFHLMYPDVCAACGHVLVRHEQCVCLSCLHAFPQTGFHTYTGNEVEKLFWGKVAVERGTAFFFYEKDSALQRAFYCLKYRGEKHIGHVLGKHAGAVLADSAFFDDVDLIVPVPLHPKKQARRGYNQSEWIGRGLSEMLKKPMETQALVREVENESQTKKSVFERYKNMEHAFAVSQPHVFAGKHVLLVDDVLTTGSTMEACIQALLQVPGVKVSVFALAVAH